MVHRTPISVIVPTLARPEREHLLRGALASIQSQTDVDARPIVVVNGRIRRPDTVAELQRQFGSRTVLVDDADLKGALQAGRARVDTPYFAELDDDDELLPGALALRLAALEQDPAAIAVASNGVIRGPDGDTLLFQDPLSELRRHPLHALLRSNWLAPGSALFRSEAVGPELLQGMPSHAEWTFLAVRLCLSGHVCFMEDATFVYRRETPFAVSQSDEFLLGQPFAMERILSLALPDDIRRGYQTKLRESCHEVADFYLRRGDRRNAWRWHWRSLRERGGWRHSLYTRRLFSMGP